MNSETTPSLSIFKQNDKNLYQCDECEQTFLRPLRLRIHKYNHTGEKPFMCKYPDCSKAYTNQSHLRRHENITHLNKIKKKEVYCDAEGCGRLLANKHSLIKHKRRNHTEENSIRFSCTECEQRFNSKSLLDAHSLCHGKEQPYACDRCNTKFIKFHLYQKHIRNHKTYKCECGEEFPRYFWLLDHKRNKCTLKPQKQRKERTEKYICNLCKKEFSSKHNLTVHGIVHRTDTQLFECSYPDCKNSYKYVRNLRWHVKTVHEKLYPKVHCPMENCNTTFKSNRNLRNHLANIHSNLQKMRPPKKGVKKGLKINGFEGVYPKTEPNENLNLELAASLNEINYSNLFNENEVLTMNYIGELVNSNEDLINHQQINNPQNIKSIIDYL